MLRSTLAAMSGVVAYLIWQKPGSTLCAEIAKRFGHDCIFCRIIGAVMREPDHCRRQLSE